MPEKNIQGVGERTQIISNDGSGGNACNLPQLKVAAFPFFAQQAAMFFVFCISASRFYYNTAPYSHFQANCAPFGWLPSTATIENIKNQASN